MITKLIAICTAGISVSKLQITPCGKERGMAIVFKITIIHPIM